jgi:hypothetical protein
VAGVEAVARGARSCTSGGKRSNLEMHARRDCQSPPSGPVPPTSFLLDRNRVIGRCQRTQLEIPMREVPRAARRTMIPAAGKE